MNITPNTSKHYLWRCRIVGKISGTSVENHRLMYGADEEEKARSYVETCIEFFENRPAIAKWGETRADTRRLIELTFVKELAG